MRERVKEGKEGLEEEMVREDGHEEMKKDDKRKERREETWPAFIHPVP